MKSFRVKQEIWLLQWIEAQRNANISPRLLYKYKHIGTAKADKQKKCNKFQVKFFDR